MKRLYMLINTRVEKMRHTSAVRAAVPYAILRVLRIALDELPAQLAISASIGEWTIAFLGLFFILRRRTFIHTEKDDASVS